jgi:hypothetical protein
MGLLDDAIREHLELKRRRGADPGEVAQEQRKALEDPQDPEAGRIVDPSSLGSVSAPEFDSAATPSNMLEETAELDMRTVLDQRADSPDVEAISAGLSGAERQVDRVPDAAAGEEPLEWEVRPEVMRESASEATRPREALSGEGVERVHATADDVVAEMTDVPPDPSEPDRRWLELNPLPDVDPDR